MLSKKDFKEIADCVNAAFISGVNPQYQAFEHGINVGCQDIGHRLADYLATQNPCFDRHKFIDACFNS